MTALEPFLFTDLLGPALWLGLLCLASWLHRGFFLRPEPALARIVINHKTASSHSPERFAKPAGWICAGTQAAAPVNHFVAQPHSRSLSAGA